MTFYVIELQTSNTGAAIPYAYDNQPDAEALYHTLLAAAAKSEISKHSVLLLGEDGFIIKKETYEHEPGPPEPDPPEEEVIT